MPRPTPWLEWARRVQSLAQTGLHYTDGVFDRERYHELRRIAAEMSAAATGTDADRVEETFTAEVGPSTPKVDVRAAVFREGRILLVRERSDGGWSLPGGWIDVGEPPSTAAIREVREESGYETRAIRRLAVWDKACHPMPQDRFHIYKLVFECELLSGEARTSIETSDVDFFSPDDLPTLSEPRVIAAQIHRLFELAGDPSATTEFD